MLTTTKIHIFLTCQSVLGLFIARISHLDNMMDAHSLVCEESGSDSSCTPPRMDRQHAADKGMVRTSDSAGRRGKSPTARYSLERHRSRKRQRLQRVSPVIY